MATDKNIVFGVKSDPRGFDAINKAVKQLSGELEKLSKLVKDLNISGAAGGKSGVQNTFLNRVVKEEAAMRKLYKTTDDTAKAIDRVFNRSVEQQAKQIENLTKKLELLNAQSEKQRKYAQMKSAAGMPVSDSVKARMAQTDQQIMETEAQRRSLMPAQSRFGGPMGMAFLGSMLQIAGQLPNAYMNSLNAPYQNRVAGATGLGGTLREQAFAGDISTFYELLKPGERDAVQKSSLSTKVGVGGGLGSALFPGVGTLGGMLAGYYMNKTPQTNNSNLSNVSYASDASFVSGLKGLWNIGSGGVGAASMGVGSKLGITGGLGDISKGFSALTPEGLKGVASQAALERAQQQVQIDVKDMPLVRDAMAHAEDRLNAFRLYGGPLNYARAMGQGRMAGIVNESEIQGLQAQLGGLVGNQRGASLFNAAANAPQNLGIGRSSAAGLLAGLTTGGGGDTTSAEQRLTDIFRKAFKAGISDSNLEEKIAQATVDASMRSVMNIGGRATGAEDMLLRALSGGPKDAGAIALAQTVFGGLNSRAQAQGGAEAVIRDRAFLQAAKAFGFGGMGIGAARTFGMEDVHFAGKLTDFDISFLKAHGGDTPDREKALIEMKRAGWQNKLRSLAQMSQVKGIQNALRSNDPAEALKNPDFSYWLSNVFGVPNNPEAITQTLNAVFGKGEITPGVSPGDRGSGTAESAIVYGKAGGAAQLYQQEQDENVQKTIKAAAQTAQNWMDLTKNFTNEEFRDAPLTVHKLAEAIMELDAAAKQFLTDRDVLERIKAK